MDSRFQKCPDGRLAVQKSPCGISRVLGYVGENADGTWSAWLNKGKGERVGHQFASQNEAGLFVYENSN
jgi:hypothetical protein